MRACWNCAQQLPDDAIFCSACGANIFFRQADGSPIQGPGGAPPRSPFAFASLACGVLGWIGWVLATGMSILHLYSALPNILGWAVAMAIAAIVLGHIARHRAKKKRGAERGKRTAFAALILGYVGLVVPPPILFVLVLIPNLDKLGGESLVPTEESVVGSLKTINLAEVSYASAYNGSFSPTLAALGPGPHEQIDAAHAGLIDTALAAGAISGYRLSYRPGRPDLEHANAITRYELVAEPEEGNPDRPSYYSDETGVIRRSPRGPATKQSPPLP